jgi:lipoprotein-anchoring transpeptidase ErfK/SrfK
LSFRGAATALPIPGGLVIIYRGTSHRDQIRKTLSHGCFRLANWNANRLAQMVRVCAPVEVVG